MSNVTIQRLGFEFLPDNSKVRDQKSEHRSQRPVGTENQPDITTKLASIQEGPAYAKRFGAASRTTILTIGPGFLSDQRSEVGDQRLEIRGRRSEDRGPAYAEPPLHKATASQGLPSSSRSRGTTT
jgi:hypothetical protein